MARAINFLKVIKNNWKKSIFGAAAFSYGVSYAINSFKTFNIMREYCMEAAVYGNQIILPHQKPQHITVILNPVAKKRKAKKLFEEYCEPLLHLAGFAVTIIQTQSENQARSLIANLNTHTDAIVVAGGDGTLSDVVTGIMRRCKDNISNAKQCPIGVLPLGQTNNVASTLFHGFEDLKEVRELAEATMAVVRGKTKLADVVKVELAEQEPEQSSEPIYAVGTVEWGAWKDARSRMDKYWYWGSLRRYVTFIFNGMKNNLSWDCKGVMHYSDPCKGCAQCYIKDVEVSTSNKRWWHVFVPKVKNFSSGADIIDYQQIVNENCGTTRELNFSATELQLITRNVSQKIPDIPLVRVEIGPENVGYRDFVAEGWSRLKGMKSMISQVIEAKDIEIHPSETITSANQEYFLYIDNEEFELRPVKFKLIPNSIKMFCS
ncbi:hypothetical protein QAD02_012497 [Eretmocerus hayati]|uniref:Uncharacterized protein n=1 Tax=Eretmocerus hayati TaxID=131215 RepID=A0ACC2P4M8_9HYME|nr:hypothetical protein QAD02_012497 [Eretmocerus hayati]